MDPIDHHVYPNLNSEVYRNLTDRLSVTDKQLQVLLINEGTFEVINIPSVDCRTVVNPFLQL